MINYQEARITELAIHRIGFDLDDEQMIITDHLTGIDDPILRRSLLRYFCGNFTDPSFYKMDTDSDDRLVTDSVKDIFENPTSLAGHSIALAKKLHAHSHHPNIRSGEFIVAHIQDVLIEDELTEVIAIFKAESQDSIVQIIRNHADVDVSLKEGIFPGKVDKACLIFNIDQESGYKILAKDRTNPGKESKYWIEDFLQLQPMEDDYFFTTHYINATKEFLKDRAKPMFDIDKGTEVGILAKSQNYFNKEQELDPVTYESEVFGDHPELVSEFQDYRQEYGERKNTDLNKNFSIDSQSLQKNSRVFRSVLKLDKNFHIYVHGNRNMIERGVDPDGRKYYKLYYEVEE